jgi:hypothetical protein
MSAIRKIKSNSRSLTAGGEGLRKTSLFLSLVFLLGFSQGASAFAVPEKLVFDLTWAGVKAGTSTLETVNDEGRTRLISTARSADWISLFYTVDDRVVSLLRNEQTASAVGLPENYRIKLREGRHRRDKELVFDHANGQVTFIDHLSKRKKTFRIDAKTLDPLSSFYRVRTLKLEVGKSVYVDVFDSKKLWNVEVQVLRREKIKTKLGEFETVVIKPLLKSEGIFNKKGDVYIWLTDDKKRIPVKLESKIAIGSITATLVGGTF